MEKTKTGMSFAEVEGGADMAGQCTQANYEHFLDVIKRRNLPIGALIIDAKWQKTFGAFDEDRAKWPDMRGFIDSCHASGIKVILWLRAWGKTEGLDEDECLKVNGRAASLDPTSPKYIERVRKGMRYMLSGAAGCLDGDGLKLDATNVIPIGRDITTYADLYGFELQRAYFELMYTSATAVKADACVSLFSANPYFRDVCNSVRLGDHYSVYGRAVDTMRQRAAVARIAMAGKPIDTDGTMRFSLEEEILPELREQAREGIPCLYQIEYLLQMRGFGEPRIRKFSEAEYAGIKNILDDYIAALQ
jgi:hypothetical protein